jgi:hypothetical protein
MASSASASQHAAVSPKRQCPERDTAVELDDSDGLMPGVAIRLQFGAFGGLNFFETISSVSAD